MTKKSRRGLRALGILLLCMAILTFLSRTIYNSTLPRVTVSGVESGALNYRASGSQLVMQADEVCYMAIEEDLSKAALVVDSVLVRAGDRFDPGDALVQFDTIHGEISLQDAQAALGQAKQDLELWDMRWMERWNELTLQRMQYETQMENPNANMDELLLRMEMLEEEFRRLEQDKLLDNSYRREYEEAYAAAKGVAERLNRLAAQDWKLTADCSGYVYETELQAGARYEGRLPLLRYVPAEEASIRIGIVWNGSVDASTISNVVISNSAGMMKKELALGWTFAGISEENGQRFLWAQTQDELPSLRELGALTFELESENYRYLVPNSAVVGGRVYLLESNTGAWGNAAHYTRAVRVDVLGSDDRYTAVEGEVRGVSQVITGWDRPLHDGAEVYVGD